jgi:hypothetical protein
MDRRRAADAFGARFSRQARSLRATGVLVAGTARQVFMDALVVCGREVPAAPSGALDGQGPCAHGHGEMAG